MSRTALCWFGFCFWLGLFCLFVFFCVISLTLFSGVRHRQQNENWKEKEIMQALNLKEEAAKLETQLESSCHDLKLYKGEPVPSRTHQYHQAFNGQIVVAKSHWRHFKEKTYLNSYRMPSSWQIPGNCQEGQFPSRRRLQIQLPGRPGWRELLPLGPALSFGEGNGGSRGSFRF